jgi:hypothetical protein
MSSELNMGYAHRGNTSFHINWICAGGDEPLMRARFDELIRQPTFVLSTGEAMWHSL